MTPSAAHAATSACLASAATGAQYHRHSPRRRSTVRLLLNRYGVSLSALVERDDELSPNFVAPVGVYEPRSIRDATTDAHLPSFSDEHLIGDSSRRA